MSRLYAAAEMQRSMPASTGCYELATRFEVQESRHLLLPTCALPNVHRERELISNGQQEVLRLWCCWAEGDRHVQHDVLYSKTHTKREVELTCRPRFVLRFLIPKCLQAKGVAGGIGQGAHVLLTVSTAILPWSRGGRALLAGVRPGLNTERCFPAGCGCDGGAVGTGARFAVHCAP